MLQVNPVTNERKRTFVNLLKAESSIVPHMELSIYKTTGIQNFKKTVMVFMGFEYKVSFYDVNTNNMKTITGIVDSVSGDEFNPQEKYISMRYWPEEKPKKDNTSCDFVTGLPECILTGKPATDKYDQPIAVDIPVNNISDMVYVKGGTYPVPPINKKGVLVVLLGISAETCRAVVINLRLIQDSSCAEEAVKDVCLKVGNCYTIAYFDDDEKSMFEFDGKLINIIESPKKPIEDTIVRRCEHVGLGDSIYNTNRYCDCNANSNAKEDYMLAEPMENDIILTFDTSMDFSGEYQSIMLSWIRDCTPIGDTEEEVDPDTPEVKPGDIHMTSGDIDIVIDGNEKEITYKHDGDIGTSTVSLQEVLDYYFGGCC